MKRSGFALLSVLWIIVVISALGMSISVTAREAITTARNRAAMTRAMWYAEGCLERARSIVSDVLASEHLTVADRDSWSMLDQTIPTHSLITQAGCNVAVYPAGLKLNLNSVDRETLHRLLSGIRGSGSEVDSLVDAALDWRDPDDVPRLHGAENAWYASNRDFPPRNGPFGDIRELNRVRGFESIVGLDSVLDVEEGRVALNHAQPAVIAALPGVSASTITSLAERRRQNSPLASLADLHVESDVTASKSDKPTLEELDALATLDPDGWIIRASVSTGTPAVTANAEIKLARAGRRAGVIRRRTWYS